MYEQLFNFGPFPCLVAGAGGDLIAVNRPARASLEMRERAAPAGLFDLFRDPEGRLAAALGRAASSHRWLDAAAEIATGALAGLRVDVSLRGAFDGTDTEPAPVLIWLRDDLPAAQRERAALIRRMNDHIDRQRVRTEDLIADLARDGAPDADQLLRIENALSILAGLIRVRIETQEEPGARRALRTAELRAHAIALVRRLHDASGPDALVDAGGPVAELCGLFAGALAADRVAFSAAPAPLTLPAREAAMLCLVTGELVAAALDAPTDGDAPRRIDLTFGPVAGGAVELGLSGDGCARAEGGVVTALAAGRGLRILDALAERIGAQLVRGAPGAAGPAWRLLVRPPPERRAFAE